VRLNLKGWNYSLDVFDIFVSRLLTWDPRASYNTRDAQSPRNSEQESKILQQPGKEGIHLRIGKRGKASLGFPHLLRGWLMDFTLKSHRTKGTIIWVQFPFLTPDLSRTITYPP